MSTPEHHKRQDVCATRASYREGRKSKAVKVYTVNQESQYLLVQGVPVVGASHELVKLFALLGAIDEYRILDEYPAEQFTEVYLIKFKLIQAARHAKRKLDDWSFFGGVLHVCYAPEYEAVQETRQKLQERRKTIAAKTRQFAKDGTYSTPSPHHGGQDSSSTAARPSGHTEVPSSTVSIKDQVESGDIPGSSSGSETTYGSHSNTQQYGHQDMSQPPDQHGDHRENHRVYAFQNNRHSNIASTSVSPHREGLIRQYESHSGLNVNRPGTSNEPEIVDDRSEEQLWLPRPPRQTQTSHNPRRLGLSRHNQLMNYEYALVPTAQAEFPVGFDARLGNQASDKTPLVSETSHDNAAIGHATSSEHIQTEKTMQERIEENLKKKDKLVIKEFKPSGAITKLIPRQAQPKQNPGKKEDNVKEKAIIKDTLNKQIRKDAFTLGRPQGPIDITREPPREPDAGDISVGKSVKDIRKRMLQLSENPALLTKKKKSADDVG